MRKKQKFKVCLIAIRLSMEEREELDQRAKAVEMSLSQYIRHSLFRHRIKTLLDRIKQECEHGNHEQEKR